LRFDYDSKACVGEFHNRLLGYNELFQYLTED